MRLINWIYIHCQCSHVLQYWSNEWMETYFCHIPTLESFQLSPQVSRFGNGSLGGIQYCYFFYLLLCWWMTHQKRRRSLILMWKVINLWSQTQMFKNHQLLPFLFCCCFKVVCLFCLNWFLWNPSESHCVSLCGGKWNLCHHLPLIT